jgi:hypothetical protein
MMQLVRAEEKKAAPRASAVTREKAVCERLMPSPAWAWCHNYTHAQSRTSVREHATARLYPFRSTCMLSRDNLLS